MREVRKLCDALRRVFDMEDWDFTLERKKGTGGADVTVDHRYRRMRVRVYDGFFREDARWQASTVIHEFAHMFNVPMSNLLDEMRNGKMVTRMHAEDILEQCNTRAESVIVRLLTDTTLKNEYNTYVKRRGSKGPEANRKRDKSRADGKAAGNRDKEVLSPGSRARRRGPR